MALSIGMATIVDMTETVMTVMTAMTVGMTGGGMNAKREDGGGVRKRDGGGVIAMMIIGVAFI